MRLQLSAIQSSLIILGNILPSDFLQSFSVISVIILNFLDPPVSWNMFERKGLGGTKI
jgi:hypothetical protein